MKITRNVIMDLLPLYLADEASEDTKALVGQYLENDPDLAEIANKSKAEKLSGVAPIPLTKEDEMEAFKDAKRLMNRRIITLAAIISFSVLLIVGMAIVFAFLVAR